MGYLGRTSAPAKRCRQEDAGFPVGLHDPGPGQEPVLLGRGRAGSLQMGQLGTHASDRTNK